MLEHVIAAILLFFGIQTGFIKGDSTTSATLPNSITITSAMLSTPSAVENTFVKSSALSLSQWDEKKASFAAHLAILKDAKKQATVEQIQTRMNTINAEQTASMMKKLLALSEGIQEIQHLTDVYVTDSSASASSVTSTLTPARQAIADAMTSVNTQAAKLYVIHITSQTFAKKDIDTAKNTMSGDLKKSRDKVQNARKKVGDSLKALKTLTGKPVSIMVSVSNMSAQATPSSTGTHTTPTVTPKGGTSL